MAQQPRVGHPSGSVAWSDGSAFNGYLSVQISPMEDADEVVYTAFSVGNRAHLQQLPQYTQLSIVEGAYEENGAGLFYNEDITPPNTEYVGTLYDATNKEVAGPTAGFTVTAGSFTPPTLTPTVPTPVPTPG